MNSMLEKTTAGFRLSTDQEHLFDVCSGERPYIGVIAVQLDGRLDKAALRRSLAHVVERNEILRTIFHRQADNSVLQVVVSAEHEVFWNEVDLTHVEPDRADEAIAAKFADLQNSDIDLSHFPLWQASLLQLTRERYVFLFALPALCADHLTLKNILNELQLSYAAELEGSEVGGMRIQYADFSAWQHELVQNEQAEQARTFWERRIAAAENLASLPFELRINEEVPFAPASVTVEIGGPFDVDDEIFLLTCWLVLLYRFTSSSEISMGVTVDGRSYEELRPALGLFAKSVPLHLRVSETATFQDVMRHVDHAVSEMREWQEYFVAPPFSKNGVQSFSFEDFGELEEASAAGVSFSTWRQAIYLEPFKLKLVCSRRAGRLGLELQYDRARFETEDIERLGQQLEVLIRNAARHPETALDRLEIISDKERRQLLYEFNPPVIDSQSVALINRLFEDQARETPDHTAVIFAGERLTYADLNAKANQLARHLQNLGAGPEVRVGIFLERSTEMVVAILSVLKAGATYVPLDPSYPEERLSFMIEDSAASVLLTVEQHADRLPVNWGYVVYLDSDWSTVELESAENLVSVAVANNAAYVIYTSGSTGRPKAVVVEHCALASYLRHAADAYLGLEIEGSVVSTPLSFDATLTSLLAPLLMGRSVELLPNNEQMMDQLSERLFAAEENKLFKLTPAHLEALQFLERPETVGMAAHVIVLGGEQLNAELLRRWKRELLPHASFVNEYGPTEATVGCTTWWLRDELGLEQLAKLIAAPIGRPTANAQLYVLGADGRLLPAGMAGELFIGGAGIARGYQERPELTAERFIPDPFSTVPGRRLYRSGDVARYRGDGQLEFRGRADNQVKLRGYRIELGEIEATLGQHGAVRESVVLLQEDEGQRRLVAYLIARPNLTLTSEELRGYLKDRLPDYMVPSAFVILDELPLTPNGKVDRAALPDPSLMSSEIKENYVAPTTPTEAVLADMWAEVLGLKRVGIYDNFFELGGHSLLATQLVSRLRNTLQLELPVALLFEVPTVAQLAEAIPKHEQVPGQTAKIAELIREVQSLPESEVEQMFEAERVQTMVAK